eukprot:scaffold74117_cov61-Phaeocystis_antarctica.AAC.6
MARTALNSWPTNAIVVIDSLPCENSTGIVPTMPLLRSTAGTRWWCWASGKVAHLLFLPLAEAPSRQELLLHRDQLGASSRSRRTRRGMPPERHRAEASRRGGTGQDQGNTSAGHDNLADDTRQGHFNRWGFIDRLGGHSVHYNLAWGVVVRSGRADLSRAQVLDDKLILLSSIHQQHGDESTARRRVAAQRGVRLQVPVELQDAVPPGQAERAEGRREVWHQEAGGRHRHLLGTGPEDGQGAAAHGAVPRRRCSA